MTKINTTDSTICGTAGIFIGTKGKGEGGDRPGGGDALKHLDCSFSQLHLKTLKL